MRTTRFAMFGALAIGLVVGFSADSLAVQMGFVGTQYNMGGNYYPTYSWPQNSIVPWRSSGLAKPLDGDGNDVYGSDGYALFATRFDFPNANAFPGYAYIDPEGDPLYPNLIDLPDWVSEHAVLTDRLAGGYAYALIDDPQLQNGPRWWTFDGTNYPPPDGTNTTGVVPYVKLGFIDGIDIMGNNPLDAPTARWGFTVGPDTPSRFRLGVMSGGGDNGNFAPSEIFLQHYNSGTTISSGELVRDRFVDMTLFDITDAQEGDQFVVGVMAGADSYGNAGIAGFSFDIVPLPEGDADFDDDTDIDVSDLMIWQRGYGATGETDKSNGDATGDGNVDGTDLEVWQLGFGTGASLGAASAVPEPSSVLLLLIGCAFCGRRMRTA